MAEYSIISEQTGKSYEGTMALEDITFSVHRGELFGFIGPDGAGKTTLFRIITTLLLADKGHMEVEGFEVKKNYRKLRQILGYMPGRFSLYQDLTVEENLKFFATTFGTTIKENYHLIKDIYGQIEPFKDRRAGALSGGMKQKLALSCALIHKPALLVLDEPTTGVDAVSRKEFWEMLRNLRREGISIVVSTPYMDEAGLCDRVALMQSGHIMQSGSPESIVQSFSKKIVAVKSTEMYRLLKDIEKSGIAETIYPFGEYAHMIPADGSIDETAISRFLESQGHSGIEAKIINAGIEDCFIELMQTVKK
ncbi:MAG: ABC transporter ATP-binding protein [Bacteroidota bacterium]